MADRRQQQAVRSRARGELCRSSTNWLCCGIPWHTGSQMAGFHGVPEVLPIGDPDLRQPGGADAERPRQVICRVKHVQDDQSLSTCCKSGIPEPFSMPVQVKKPHRQRARKRYRVFGRLYECVTPPWTSNSVAGLNLAQRVDLSRQTGAVFAVCRSANAAPKKSRAVLMRQAAQH